MRKFINWMVFLGKCVTAIGSAFEPLIPAWDDVKAKNSIIDEAENKQLLDVQNPIINEIKTTL